MKSIARIVLGAAFSTLPVVSATAANVTTIFNNGGAGTGTEDSWSADNNWSNTSPLTISNAGNTALVQIGTQPANNLIGVDTGFITNTIGSLTFNATLTDTVDITFGGLEQLTVNGPITNSSNFTDSFSLVVLMGATSTIAGGTGGLTFSNQLDVQTSTVTATGTVTISGNINGTTGTLVTGDGVTSSLVTLSGSSAFYTGGITIAANGTLQLGDGGTNGDVGTTPSIVDNGTLKINRSDTLTGAAVISGTGGLIQAGTGGYTLTGANTFSGNTSVTAGTLTLSNALALQNSTLTTGGTGIVFSSTVGSHAFTLGGLSGSTNLALADNAGTPNAVALTVGKNNASTTYSGVLSGAGSLTKSGTGTFTISGANTFTGSTTVSAGTLLLSNALALQSSTVTSGGTGLVFSSTVGGHAFTLGGLSGSANLALADNAGTPNAVALTVGNNNASTTYSGVMSGAGSLTKSGTGTLTVSGANTFTGSTTVSAGTLLLSNALALQSSTVTSGGTGLVFSSTVGTHAFTLGGLSGSANLALADNAGTPNAVALSVGNNNSSTTYSGVLSGAGSLTKIGTGNLTISGTNTYTGGTTISAGTLTVNGSTSATGTLAVATAGTLAGTGTVNGNATVTGNGIINLTGGTIAGTLGITGGNWNGTGTVTGQATETSGVLTIGNGANMTATTGLAVTGGTIAAGNSSSTLTGSLNYTSASSSTFAGVVAGAGNTLTLNNAAATLTLSGTNTYTGATTVTAGTLAVNGSTAAGSTVNIATAGTLAGTGTVNGNATVTGNGIINLTGGTIAGTLGITGGNWNGTGTVTGQATSSSGTFTIGSGANLTATTGLAVTGGTLAAGSGTSTLTGSLNYTSGSNSTFAGKIVGAGNTVTLNNAAANLTLSGVNTYTGATSVTAGTLTVNGSTASGSAVGVASTGTLAGTGTVGGNVTVTSGTVNMTGGTISGTLTSTGGANVNGTETVTGLTTGNGGALTIGSGANLTANGGVAITSGTLAAAAANSTITGSVNYTSASSSIYQGILAGAAKTFTLNNAAAVFTMSGANTYTGATTVTAGTLNVTGSTASGSAVSVGSAGILTGTGTVNGPLTVTSSGVVAPGTTAGTAGTLHVGSLGFTINNGGVLDLDLNTATTAGGGVNDLVAMTGGTLTFGGTTTINLNTLGTLTTGTAYTLINGASSVSGFNAANFTLNGLPSNLTATFTDSANALFVTFTSSATTAYYFTGADNANPTVFDDPANYNTLASGGIPETVAPGATTDIFIGATNPAPPVPPALNSSVAVLTNITVNSITFTPTGAGYSVTGGGVLTVNSGITVQSGVHDTENFTAAVALGGSQNISVVDSDSTLQFSGGLSGTGTLTKTGAGMLEFVTDTSYTGATVISAGTLRVDTNGGLASTSSVSVASGAVLQLDGLTTTTAVPLTLNGTGISGAGALESLGNSTYTGLVTLGSATTIASDAGTLNLSNAGTITGSGFGLTLDGAANGTISSIIGTGAGTLTKNGAGTWTLSGVNTYTGATTINQGTLALSGAGSIANSSSVTLTATPVHFSIAAASGARTVKDLSGGVGSFIDLGANNLTFGTTNSTTIASTIADGGNGGSITKAGTGTVTLSGTNTFTGGSTINAGILKVASVATNLGTGAVSLGGGELLTTTTSTAANTLQVNPGANTIAAVAATTATYSGTSAGSGPLNIGDATNTGTIVFTGANAYSGTTTVAANTTLQVGAGSTTGTLGSGAVTDNGTVTFNRSNALAVTNAISGGGKVIQSGAGTTTLSATNTYSGGTTITNGALSVTAVDTNLGTGTLSLGGGELITTGATPSTAKAITLTAGTDTIAAATGTTAIYSGVISGTALTVGDGANTGKVVLTGTNTYSGTTISNGTLQVGNGAAAGSITGNVLNNSALIFNHTGTFNYTGVISGTGTVTSTQGTLNLSGTNTYNGATTITAGTLQLSGTGSISNSAVSVNTGTTLAAIGTSNGVGDLTINAGTVNLQNSASNTLTGSTLTVAAAGGTISIDVGATAGTSDLLSFTGAATFGATPLTINVASLGNAAIGTHYTFATATGGGLSTADFTAGTLTGLLAGDSVVFGLSGNSIYLQINGPAVSTFYFTGVNSTDFTDISNYNTTASGNVIQTNPLDGTSQVFIGTTTPTPTTINPVLNSNQTIGSLIYTPSGSGSNLTGTGTLTVNNGVTVQTGVAGTETIAAAVALGGTQNWTVTDAASTLVDSGGISGAFGLTKAGAGKLVFSGVNTYTGATTVSTGILNLQNSGAINGTSGVTVASGAALQLQGGITTAAKPLSLAGTGVGGNGALENVSGANTYAGLVTLTGATTIGSDAGTLTLSNVGTITGSGFGLTLAGAGNGAITSIIGTGTGGVTKTGAGTWTLNGVNTYTGATTVNAGTLAVGAAGSIASSSGVNLAASGTTLDLTSGSKTIKDLTGVAGSTVSLGGSALTLGTGNSTTFAGAITGAGGSVTKIGAGTLTLSGTNTYSGGTTLNGGVVKVASANTNLGSGNLTFGGGELVTTTTSATSKTATLNAGTNTIAAANGTTATYNGAIGGTGALTVGDPSNAGTVVLNAANTFNGAHLTGGNVVLGNAASLGSGDVSFSAGTLSSTANEIDVAGNYTQTGGTLVLNLSGTTQGGNPGYQFLNVTGTAALGGALQVVVSNMYVPVTGDAFTFVQAASITGGFSSVSSNLFSLQITAQGGGLIISQSPFATLPGANYTPNQLAVATYVDQSFQAGAASAGFQQLLASLNSLTANGSASLLPDAFSQLSPDKFENFVRSDVINNVSFMTQSMTNYQATQRSVDGDFIVGNGQIDSSNMIVMGPGIDPNLAMVSSRLLAWNPANVGHGLLSDVPNPVLGGIELRDAKNVEAPAPEGNPINTFIMGNVVMAQNFSQPDVPHADSTTGAVQLGADYRITPHLRAGAMFGYGHTEATLDNNNSKATSDTYSPGVYLSYAQKGWYANALASYGFDQFTSDRAISFGSISGVAHGAPSGDQIVGNLDGGYDFHHKSWTFGPTLGVQYTHLNVNSYSEDGVDAADLNVGKQETDSLRSRLGGHVSYLYQTGKITLTPHLDASWQHEFMDQSRGITSQFTSVGAGSFSIQTPNPSRDSALIDAGLSADLNGQVTVFGDYAVQAGQDNYFGQSVQAGVKVGF